MAACAGYTAGSPFYYLGHPTAADRPCAAAPNSPHAALTGNTKVLPTKSGRNGKLQGVALAQIVDKLLIRDKWVGRWSRHGQEKGVGEGG